MMQGTPHTAQKMKFSIKDFFSKYDQISMAHMWHFYKFFFLQKPL